MRIFMSTALLCLMAGHPASSTSYAFTVNCPYGSRVVDWRTGAIDPGREYLRVAIGMEHAGCSVSDFDPVRDQGLDREVVSAEAAVLRGVPLLGTIVSMFGGW